MASLDEILNFAIPILLLLIALGFIYVKLLQPFVLPMLGRFIEWSRGKKEEQSQSPISMRREITYE